MRRFLALAGLTCGLAVLGASDDATACGGCFIPEGSASTVVTGHRMALSISQQRTVLWDQIQYTGDPEDFSWVLPVKPGAVLEVANDAWFDVLEAATQTTVGGAAVQCTPNFGGGFDGGSFEGGGSSSGFGCGSDDLALAAPNAAGEGSSTGTGGMVAPPEEPVEVVSEGSAGPYDMVTLSTDVPGALNEWLDENGYAVPDEMQPIIDAYVEDGFDFIALRLSPETSVRQMKPVRVITPGSSFALPLQMVAAGTGENTALTLFMLGEGRYEAQNFENVLVPQNQPVWDYNTSSSNYSELRREHLDKHDGRAWLTSYARNGSLLGATPDGLGQFSVSYNVGASQASSIAEAYVLQGWQNGEGSPAESGCLDYFQLYNNDMGLVVEDLCEPGDMDCRPTEEAQIDSANLACGDLDDVATALVGMHPRDVWITRMEANLPRTALDQDLLLEAADEQAVVENRYFAQTSDNHPCPDQSSGLALGKPKGPAVPGGPVTVVLLGAAAGLFARRRRRQSSATRSESIA